MSAWTIVIEVTDHSERGRDQEGMEAIVYHAINSAIPPDITFKVMEVTNAPYGPDKKD